MGLDTTHDCWHGAYSAFSRWREKLAEAAELPPLALMDGFYRPPDPEALTWLAPAEGGPACGSHFGPHVFHWLEGFRDRLPLRWEALKPDPLHLLLNHSDCDGKLEAKDCAGIADSLERLLPALDGDGGGHIGLWRGKTQTFIDGLRRAAAAGEDVGFH
jgi:hypothetical protein